MRRTVDMLTASRNRKSDELSVVPPTTASLESHDAREIQVEAAALVSEFRDAPEGTTGVQPAPERDVADGRQIRRIRGILDGVEKGVVTGWAFDEDRPTTRLPIEIWQSDVMIAAGEASTAREDLRKANFADGCCAFVIPLPAGFKISAAEEFYAKIGDEGPVLARAPTFHFSQEVLRAGPEIGPADEISKPIDRSETKQSPEASSQPTAAADTVPARSKEKKIVDLSNRTIRGQIDEIVSLCARGWAVDEAAPTKRLQIEIWAEGALIAAGHADQERSDLVEAKLGDGKCAFSIPLPMSFADGKPHTVFAKVSGQERPLDGSAFFSASAKSVRGSIEGLDGLTLRGWAESDLYEWANLDFVIDGISTGSVGLPPFTPDRLIISHEVPLAFADGRVHWFQFKVRHTGVIVAETVASLPMVGTPESALQTYARDFPGFLSTNAAARYDSLVGQIEILADTLQRQSADDRALSLSDGLRQLALVHSQVKIGIREQAKTPDRLKFPRYQHPDVSVVIPAHDKFWVTYNCLAALLLAPNRHTFEVIVVDDGSSDMTAKLGEYVDGISVLRNEVAQGFVRSSNLGGRHARGDFVVMLNNDTEPCAAWIDELVHVFENFTHVGLAGAKFVYPDGKLQESGGILFPNLDAWNYGRNGNPFDPRYNYTRQVDYVSGACIMLRKSVWDQLGGFDEFFAPAYYEDTDLAFRVRALGLKTYCAPLSKVIHFEGVSSGTSLSSGVKRYQAINEPKFRSRWASVLRNYPSSLDPEIAKDRGVTLRALVIDAETPTPDKDAGSYAALQEMRLLQALGLKLTFVPINMAYMGNYTETLQRAGVECVFAPFVTSIDQILERRAHEFDVYYITRYAIADLFVDKIRVAAPRAKIVFNNADLHFLREIRAAIASKNAEAIPKALQTRDIELAVMRKTDVTLSYTDTEAAVILSHNLDTTKVARCPWVVEVEDEVEPFANRSGLAFLGNYRHVPNGEAVRYFISEVMPELRRVVPGLTLKIYGANMPADLRKLAGDGVEIAGHVADVAEVYQTCRIFVAPLLSGAGIKGKVIGALAAGAPTVMTTLASEGIGVSRGVEAFVADSVPEWVEAIASLYGDEARWTEMSSRARDFARRNFSFENGLGKMKAALAMAGVYVG